jgi:hypothetical protein
MTLCCDTSTLPIKNEVSVIGLCISYHYTDTLQYMLPSNYLHFEKIYIATQEDDIQTIELCKQYRNVDVIFYQFNKDDKKFDKYGALNLIQSIAYKEYPDSWYINIDSDIILPVNFGDLFKTQLNPECIYGCIRLNCTKSSELIHKSKLSKSYMFNNILFSLNKPPSIVGCFQLYKKKVFHKNFNDASEGDLCFCHDNFTMFCRLPIAYIHLGPSGVNWKGKVKDFIIDHDIKNIWFTSTSTENYKYYNHKRNLIKN